MNTNQGASRKWGDKEFQVVKIGDGGVLLRWINNSGTIRTITEVWLSNQALLVTSEVMQEFADYLTGDTDGE